MKNYFKTLLSHITVLLILLSIGFLSCFVITDFYNNSNAYYEAEVVVEDISKFETEKLVDEDFLLSIRNSADKYSEIDVKTMLKKKDFSYEINESKITIVTKYRYYEEFFLSKSNSVSNRAKTFIKDAVNEIAKEKTSVTFTNSNDIVTLNGYVNRWNIGLIGLIVTFVLELIVFSILYIYKKDLLIKEKFEYDNETCFSTCFHKNYWKEATKPLIKVKDITTIAMMFALLVVAGIITLPSGFGNLGLSLAYLFFAMIAMVYGPVYAFVIGIFSDIIGYFTSNSAGAFNFGYTIQAAMCGFIYGICLYKTKITFTKVFISRTLVNLLMNTIVGSFLFIFVMYFNTGDGFDFSNYLEKVKYYMLLMALPKNVLYLLPQSLVLYLVLRLVSPVLVKFRLMDKKLIDYK